MREIACVIAFCLILVVAEPMAGQASLRRTAKVPSLDSLVSQAVFSCTYWAECADARTWLTDLGYEVGRISDTTGKARVISNVRLASILTSNTFDYLGGDSLFSQIARRRFLKSPAFFAAKVRLTEDSIVLTHSWFYTIDLRIPNRIVAEDYDTTSNALKILVGTSGRYYPVGSAAPPASRPLTHYLLEGLPRNAIKVTTERSSAREYLQWRYLWANVSLEESVAWQIFADASQDGPSLETPDFQTSAVVPVVLYRIKRLVPREPGNVFSYVVSDCAFLLLANVKTKQVYATKKLSAGSSTVCKLPN